MELSDSKLTLSQINEDTWYFVESDQSNEITGIKMTKGKIWVQYIGGDFEEPFIFWFEYNQLAFNEIWQYEFRADYNHQISKDKDTLYDVNEITYSAYTMANDLSYTCQHIGIVEKKGYKYI
jgi:hypothetical protein